MCWRRLQLEKTVVTLVHDNAPTFAASKRPLGLTDQFIKRNRGFEDENAFFTDNARRTRQNIATD
jgi:hypothetical protein